MTVYSYRVEIESSDDRTEAHELIAKRIIHNLHLMFGDAAQLYTDSDPAWHFIYDPLADDGHHDGHDVPLTREIVPDA